LESAENSLGPDKVDHHDDQNSDGQEDGGSDGKFDVCWNTYAGNAENAGYDSRHREA
jgi:hypothetical protein